MVAPTFTSGQVLTAEHCNEWLRGPLWVRKTEDEARNQTTTFADDDELFIDVDANKIYWFEMRVLYNTPASVDIKFQLSVPSGSLIRGYAHRLTTGAVDTGNFRLDNLTEDISVGFGSVSPSEDQNGVFNGVLSISSTAGQFGLQWAQLSSSATNTRVRANSYIALQRVE